MPVIRCHPHSGIKSVDQVSSPLIRAEHGVLYSTALEKLGSGYREPGRVEFRCHHLMTCQLAAVAAYPKSQQNHQTRPAVSPQFGIKPGHAAAERVQGPRN